MVIFDANVPVASQPTPNFFLETAINVRRSTGCRRVSRAIGFFRLGVKFEKQVLEVRRACA